MNTLNKTTITTLVIVAILTFSCKKQVLPLHTTSYYYQPTNSNLFTMIMGDSNSDTTKVINGSNTNTSDSSAETQHHHQNIFVKYIKLEKTSTDNSKKYLETANYTYNNANKVNHIEGKYEIVYTNSTQLIHTYSTDITYTTNQITQTITKKYGIESQSTNKYNHEYYLDNNGRVYEYVEKTNLGEINFRYLYEYDSNGVLIKIKRAGTTNREVIHQIMDLKYDNDNLMEIKNSLYTYDKRILVDYTYFKYSNRLLVNQDEIGQAVTFGITLRYDKNGNSFFGKRLNKNIISEISSTRNGNAPSPTLVGEAISDDSTKVNIYQYTNNPKNFITSMFYNRYVYTYEYFTK